MELPRPAGIPRHFGRTRLKETQHGIIGGFVTNWQEAVGTFRRRFFSSFGTMEAVDFWVPDVS
jgi:hypothetical protein